MKFIRLVSEERNGVLDNEFNTDIKEPVLRTIPLFIASAMDLSFP